MDLRNYNQKNKMDASFPRDYDLHCPMVLATLLFAE
jgi:hypothetical protein